MDSKDILEEVKSIRRKFGCMRKLLNDDKKYSTEKAPYDIKYKVIALLREIEGDIVELSEDVQMLEEASKTLLLAVVYLNIGLLEIDSEEQTSGKNNLTKCMEILKGRESEPDAVIIILSCLNQLGILSSQWRVFSKAKEYLDEAEEIYNKFKDTGEEPTCLAFNFGIEDTKDESSPKEILEMVHTLSLYYLAQIYGALEEHHKSAVYCHRTLSRQLRLDHIRQDLNYVEWALNAATLSQYFMENDSFTQARNHLAAASYMLRKYETAWKEKTANRELTEEEEAEWETLKHRSSDVAICWAKYGILLLSLSKQKLLQDAEAEDGPSENKVKEKSKDFGDLNFEILDKDIDEIVDQITDDYLLDFNDAKPVFLNTQKWLEQAKTYYTLENHASDYVKIIQDMSQAYKYLSFYEEHEDRQAKMHKRRVDMLENVVKELHPLFYKVACRQIWIELGETYSDILDIKLDRLRSTDEKPTAHALTKVNHLAKSAIKWYQSFLDTLDNGTSSDGITEFPYDLAQPALLAYFSLGRLHCKIVTPDKKMQLENTQNSINAYQFIIDYCEKYPNAAEKIKVELNLCKELLSLLPYKLNRLREEIAEKP